MRVGLLMSIILFVMLSSTQYVMIAYTGEVSCSCSSNDFTHNGIKVFVCGFLGNESGLRVVRNVYFVEGGEAEEVLNCPRSVIADLSSEFREEISKYLKSLGTEPSDEVIEELMTRSWYLTYPPKEVVRAAGEPVGYEVEVVIAGELVRFPGNVSLEEVYGDAVPYLKAVEELLEKATGAELDKVSVMGDAVVVRLNTADCSNGAELVGKVKAVAAEVARSMDEAVKALDIERVAGESCRKVIFILELMPPNPEAVMKLLPWVEEHDTSETYLALTASAYGPPTT